MLAIPGFLWLSLTHTQFPQLVKVLDIPNSPKDVKNFKVSDHSQLALYPLTYSLLSCGQTKLKQIAAQYFNKRVAPKDQPEAQARIGKCVSTCQFHPKRFLLMKSNVTARTSVPSSLRDPGREREEEEIVHRFSSHLTLSL